MDYFYSMGDFSFPFLMLSIKILLSFDRKKINSIFLYSFSHCTYLHTCTYISESWLIVTVIMDDHTLSRESTVYASRLFSYIRYKHNVNDMKCHYIGVFCQVVCAERRFWEELNVYLCCIATGTLGKGDINEIFLFGTLIMSVSFVAAA